MKHRFLPAAPFLAAAAMMVLSGLAAAGPAKPSPAPAGAAVDPASPASAYRLKPEWKGPCRKAEEIDVNLGNTPEAFVRAAYCQCNGKEPSAAVVKEWVSRLREEGALRRVDVVRTFAKDAGREIKLKYSNPWAADPAPVPRACAKKGKRDVGVVFMFFFHCPGGTNCGMDWANSHAYGMGVSDTSLVFSPADHGFCDPGAVGWWRRELRDMKAAGLQFFLPNTYGPDMIQEGKIKILADALDHEADPVRVGLYDDTWAWGEKWFGEYFQTAPDLNEPDKAARKLFEAKWQPFFTQVKRKYWYMVDGKPLIYFYNANKLLPRNKSAAVLARMREMFKREFGVYPFLAVDKPFWEDPKMGNVADSQFEWVTLDLPNKVSRFSKGGKTLCHATVKWDTIGRDRPGEIPAGYDRLVKGPELLKQVLDSTQDADILTLATWNDLGEGTGIGRCFDYYYLGSWLTPDYFMRLVWDSQSQ